MTIVIVRPPLQQASIEPLKSNLRNDDLVYTNSKRLATLRPNTNQVGEPSHEQLIKVASQQKIIMVYPNTSVFNRDLNLLREFAIEPIMVVGDKEVSFPKQIDQKDCLMTPNGAQLRPYQQQLVDFALETKRSALFVDMGLGKTLATLATINELFSTNRIPHHKPVLIIGPKMVALDTWSREVEKWGYDIDVLVNVGLAKKKRDQLFEQVRNIKKPTILTTNPEQLSNILSAFGGGHESPFDMVVVDELSMFKSHNSQRFEKLQWLTHDVSYFIGLTGTPAPNSLLDIWSELVLVDPQIKYRLGDNFFKYRGYYFEPDMMDRRTGQIYSWKLQRGAEDAIYEKIEPYVISMRGNGLIDIPDVTYTNEYVEMNRKAETVYKYLDSEIRKELRELEASGERGVVSAQTGDAELVISNKAILKSKLIQLATGAIYDNEIHDDGTNFTVFHDAKIQKLKELVEVSTSPVLIYYNFISDLERIKSVLPDAVLLDTKSKSVKDIIKQWNDGKISVMLANPRSVGHGLNLQDGGHIIIWFSLTWFNEVYRQANKRLHRSGQKHPVQIIHIVTRNTADEEVLPRINGKEEGQQDLLDALQSE